MMNKIWGSALVAMGAVAGLGGVAEAAVQTELALVIDGSGSISSSNFSAQRTAYQTALQNVFNAHPSFFGQVAIGVWQFSTGVQLEQAIIEIDSQTDLDTVKTAIANMVQLNGNTAIGDGITTARTSLLTNGIDSNRQVIDVSTDGFNNVGSIRTRPPTPRSRLGSSRSTRSGSARARTPRSSPGPARSRSSSRTSARTSRTPSSRRSWSRFRAFPSRPRSGAASASSA